MQPKSLPLPVKKVMHAAANVLLFYAKSQPKMAYGRFYLQLYWQKKTGVAATQCIISNKAN